MNKKKQDKKFTKDQAEKKILTLKKIFLILDLKKLIIRLIILLNIMRLKKV